MKIGTTAMMGRAPGRQGCPVLLGGQRHQRVINGAARDAQGRSRFDALAFWS